MSEKGVSWLLESRDTVSVAIGEHRQFLYKGWAGYWRAETQFLWLLESTDTVLGETEFVYTVCVQGVSWLLESWVCRNDMSKQNSTCVWTCVWLNMCLNMSMTQHVYDRNDNETKLNMCMRWCIHTCDIIHFWKGEKKGMPKRHDSR